MFSRTLLLCLMAAVLGTGFSLSCKWMDHKFSECSETSLDLLETMASNATNSTGQAGVAFPTDLYSLAAKASDEDKVGFTVQVLEEVADLFQGNQTSALWQKGTAEDFLSVVHRQAEGLRSCIGSHKKNKKLQMYFKRLSRHVLEQMGHSAESWELVRKQVKTHLMRTDHLVSSLLTVN